MVLFVLFFFTLETFSEYVTEKESFVPGGIHREEKNGVDMCKPPWKRTKKGRG